MPNMAELKMDLKEICDVICIMEGVRPHQIPPIDLQRVFLLFVALEGSGHRAVRDSLNPSATGTSPRTAVQRVYSYYLETNRTPPPYELHGYAELHKAQQLDQLVATPDGSLWSLC